MCLEKVKATKIIPKFGYKIFYRKGDKLKSTIYEETYEVGIWNEKKGSYYDSHNPHLGRIQVLTDKLDWIVEKLDWKYDEIWKVQLKCGKDGGFVGEQRNEHDGMMFKGYLVDKIKLIKCVEKKVRIMYKENENVLVKREIHGTDVDVGDIVKIIKLRGGGTYSIEVIKSKIKSEMHRNYEAYDDELKPLRKESIVESLKEEISQKTEEFLKVKKEISQLKEKLEIVTKYKDEEDYIAKKIKEMYSNGCKEEDVRKFLKNRPEF